MGKKMLFIITRVFPYEPNFCPLIQSKYALFGLGREIIHLSFPNNLISHSYHNGLDWLRWTLFVMINSHSVTDRDYLTLKCLFEERHPYLTLNIARV